jgi:RNA polymerase sigma-70 factor (ECF subfamily)
MDENPKRIKKKDDPYTIKKVGSEYIVSFKDAFGILQEVKVTQEVYAIFNEYELKDKKEMNEFDRHIEHSEIYEDNLVIRAKEKTISMEDEFIQKSTFEELNKAIDLLPEIQKRRVKKYYFEDLSENEIAENEGVSQKNVSETLKAARDNLKKILKIFN